MNGLGPDAIQFLGDVAETVMLCLYRFYYGKSKNFLCYQKQRSKLDADLGQLPIIYIYIYI